MIFTLCNTTLPSPSLQSMHFDGTRILFFNRQALVQFRWVYSVILQRAHTSSAQPSHLHCIYLQRSLGKLNNKKESCEEGALECWAPAQCEAYLLKQLQYCKESLPLSGQWCSHVIDFYSVSCLAWSLRCYFDWLPRLPFFVGPVGHVVVCAGHYHLLR